MERGPRTSAQAAPDLRRATYYLRPDQIRALKLCSAFEGRPLSAVVREAIDRYVDGHAPPAHRLPRRQRSVRIRRAS